MRFRLEEDGAAEECSFGDDDNAAAILGCPVDDGLYFLRLQDCTVVCHTVIGNGILLSQCVDVYDLVLSEPVGNRRAVGEFLLPGHLQADKCRK